MRPRQITVEFAVAVVALAVLLSTVFNTVQLTLERATLTSIRAAQDPSVAEVLRIRTQLESLAGETAKLAETGNANAQAVVDDMKRQGVTMRPPPLPKAN